MGARPVSSFTLVTWLLLLSWIHLLIVGFLLASSQGCLPSCTCSWRGGKFVADCSSQNLNQVPKNEHHEYLVASAGNNQMPTLTRDIQSLNLTSNNIVILRRAEFYRKKFRNLQKIYLAANKLLRIDQNAFYKLTGLVELDLSENLLAQLDGEQLDESYSTSGLFSEDFDDIQELSVNTPTATTRLGFLHDLSQLRLLNLASNQLTSLSASVFVSQTQLRQLILSRNKIRSIDKRAFVGLEMLNVLHLDGNEISHLDGSILLQMGKLHALRLAGPSWTCDCRLRKLVRLLGAHKKQKGVVNVANLTTTNALILEDEPECSQGGKAWSSMTLTQFECPPRVALQFMPSSLSPWQPQDEPAGVEQTSSVMNMNDEDEDQSGAHNGVTEDQDNGDPARPAESRSGELTRNASLSVGANQDAHRRIKSERFELPEERWAPERPVGLTCAVELTDELDLDLMQLDWWQLDEPAERRLIWRSGVGQTPCQLRARQTKLEFTVIDYVTRANESGRTIGAKQAGQTKELAAKREKQDEEEGKRRLQPIRVVHLILAPSLGRASAPKRQYVCRVTNQSGRLELLHRLNSAQTLSRAPPNLSLEVSSTSMQQVQLELERQPSRADLDAARATLRAAAHADTSGAPTWPTFQPLCLSGLHLSQQKHQTSGRTSDELAKTPAGSRQLASTRQTTMRANATVRIVHLDDGDSARGSPEPPLEPSTNASEAAMLTAELAVHLVVSYMSNRKSLIEQLFQNSTEEELAASMVAAESAGHVAIRSLADRLVQIRTRYLNKWIELARGSDVTLLVATCLGLILGSLLTVLVIVRLKCSRRHRVVGDLYTSKEAPAAPSETSAESTATGSDRKLIADSSCSPPSSNSDLAVQKSERPQQHQQSHRAKLAIVSDNLWQVDSSTCQSADDEAEVDPEEEAQDKRIQCAQPMFQQGQGSSGRCLQQPGATRCHQELLIGAPRRPGTLSRAQQILSSQPSLLQTRECAHMQMRHPNDYQRASRNQSCSYIHLDPGNLDLAFINKVSPNLPRSNYQQVANVTDQAGWATLSGGNNSAKFCQDFEESSTAYLLSPGDVGSIVIASPAELGQARAFGPTAAQLDSQGMSNCSEVESTQTLRLHWLPPPPSLTDVNTATICSPSIAYDGPTLVSARPASESSFVSSSPSFTSTSQLNQAQEQMRCTNQQNFAHLNDAIKLLDD